MTDQLDLFAAPSQIPSIAARILTDPTIATRGAHHTLPRDTEAAAAIRVWPRTGTQRMTVLHAIANAGPEGLTDPEIAATTGLYLYSAAPRRTELVEGGWVIDSGLRRTTQHGRDAIAWRLNPDAHDEYVRRYGEGL